MFYTYTNWKSKIHDRLCAPNQQYWLGVELALNTPWFLITVSQTELVEGRNDVVFRREIMVANVAEIDLLAQQQGDGVQKLESAMIVIPNWINGAGTWTMEPLAAVWVADEPDAPGATVEICEIQSGAKFVTTFGACSLEKLINHTLRYRFPAQERENVDS
jgi:hypothetical protein